MSTQTLAEQAKRLSIDDFFSAVNFCQDESTYEEQDFDNGITFYEFSDGSYVKIQENDMWVIDSIEEESWDDIINSANDTAGFCMFRFNSEADELYIYSWGDNCFLFNGKPTLMNKSEFKKKYLKNSKPNTTQG